VQLGFNEAGAFKASSILVHEDTKQDINIKRNGLTAMLMRGISCQFLPPGGSMGLGYVLKLLFSQKS
jgi:hypothetical protein